MEGLTLSTLADEAQAGAQAEALDADLERNTMALRQRNATQVFFSM
jgi:hypothetical protein